jgi:hypothetical protein
MADDVVIANSGADLVGMAPEGLFDNAGTEAPPEPTESGEGAEPSTPETFETPEELAAEPEQTEAENAEEAEGAEQEPEQAEETKPAEPSAPQTTEELPEGVRSGKDRNGKDGCFVEKSRWENVFHPAHKLVQAGSELLGEPLTLESLTERNDAFMAQERMYTDLQSGDPATQAKVFNFILDESSRAVAEGEVPSDPSEGMAQAFYGALQSRAASDPNFKGYAALRLQAARDLVGEMFQEAAIRGDNNLRLSVQHLARALTGLPSDATPDQVRAVASRMGIPFYAQQEMASLARGADPAQAEIARLRAENARLSGTGANSQAAQLDQFVSGTKQQIGTALQTEVITPALASVAEQWKDFPEDYRRLVVEPLHREIVKTIAGDRGFNDRIQLLHQQAARAASAQRREVLGRQIVEAYVNRAKLAAEAHRAPILRFAADTLKERSDKNHARRQAAQARTVPKGASGTVPRSILGKPGLIDMGDTYDPDVAYQNALRLVNG